MFEKGKNLNIQISFIKKWLKLAFHLSLEIFCWIRRTYGLGEWEEKMNTKLKSAIQFLWLCKMSLEIFCWIKKTNTLAEWEEKMSKKLKSAIQFLWFYFTRAKCYATHHLIWACLGGVLNKQCCSSFLGAKCGTN